MTTRQNILTHLQATLEAVDTVKYVELERAKPIDLDTLPIPCVFVYSGEERRVRDERAIIGQETWDWFLTLEVWTNDDPEIILGKIHKAMYDDRFFGNHAVDSERDSIEGIYIIDEDSNIKSMMLNYIVTYRHTLGTM